MPKQEPQRSCLGCRAVRHKHELLRFVMAPNRELVIDLLGKLPGRGAYTCYSQDCLRSAFSRRQFNRVFKGEVFSPGTEETISRILLMLEERIGSYIAVANKAGQVVSGTDMVIDSLRKQEAGVVVLGRDVSPDIKEKVRFAAERAGVENVELLQKDRLGTLTGKAMRSAVAIGKGGVADKVIKELRKYRNFFEGGTLAR